MGQPLSIRRQSTNANKHTERGLGLLDESIARDGWIGAITVAADGEAFDGSARIAVSEGLDDAIVIRSDGSRPIVHIREDIPTADDERARRLSVAANQIAAVDWNPEAALLATWGESDDAIRAMWEGGAWAGLLGGAVQIESGGGGGGGDETTEEGDERGRA